MSKKSSWQGNHREAELAPSNSDESDGMDRRDFLKLVGVGASVAAASCEAPPRNLYPHVVPPQDALVGQSTYYMSVCRECPAGCGLMARVREGRPVKLEGNPAHPVNAGRLCARGQAGVLHTYDPERIRRPRDQRGDAAREISWRAALREVAEAVRGARDRGAGRVLIWTGPETGTLLGLYQRFAAAVGGEHLMFDPHELEPLIEAHRIAFSRRALFRPDLSESDLVVALEADIFETYLSPVEIARQVAGDAHEGERRAELAWVGPRRGVTGVLADQWIPARPGAGGLIALALLSRLVEGGGAMARAVGAIPELGDLLRAHDASELAERAGVEADDIAALARKLATADRPVVLPPGALGTGMQGVGGHLAAVVLDQVLGAYGRELHLVDDHALAGLTPANDLRAAVGRMGEGEVDVLIVAGANPVYDLPAGSDLAAALERVDLVVALADRPNATVEAADIVLPVSTPLESWGDYSPRSGVRGLMQPTTEPLYPTRMAGDVVLGLAHQVGVTSEVSPTARTFEELLRETWAGELSGREAAEAFREAQRRGGRFAEPPAGAAAEVQPAAIERLREWLSDLPEVPEGLILTTYAPVGAGLNELATGAWLYELPEPTSATVWGSPAEIHPELAERLGVGRGDPREGEAIEVRTGQGMVRLPVVVADWVRPDVVAVPYGGWPTREITAHFEDVEGAELVDYEAARLRGEARPATSPSRLLPAAALADGAGVVRSGLAVEGVERSAEPIRRFVETRQLSQHVLGENRGLARARGIDLHLHEHPELPRELTDMYGPREYPTYRWGMAIDLDKCTACSACVVACYAENNVGIVGPEQVDYGREMAWLLIHVYWEHDQGGRAVPLTLPMLCQHCHQAPCESVCPVYAPYQTPEGLNAQIYNRCVGTRFCANNCPYKVRRFNWFHWARPEPMQLQLNPDVSYRSDGVMEKCTFCVQRIREAKEQAKLEGRERVRDGEIVPACVQTCPTGALVFGDITDPESRVSRLIEAQRERAYRVLEHVGTRPAITYLERVVRWRS